MTANVSGVSQGVISPGINGEGILIFYDTCFKEMADCLNYSKDPICKMTVQIEAEVMNEISNILIIGFLKGLEEQLDIHFSQGQPTLLGQHQH